MPVLLLCLCALSYFAYHASQGRHGLETRAKLQARSVALSLEIERLEAVKDQLEQETAALGAEPPDADLIDIYARRTLGFLEPGERRLTLPSAPR